MGQNPAFCCGPKASLVQGPAVLNIDEELHAPLPGNPFEVQGKDQAHSPLEGELTTARAVPQWLSALAPALVGEEAERAAEAWLQCKEDWRRRSRQFVRRVKVPGVSCRVIDQRTGRAVLARYSLDDTLSVLTVEANSSSSSGSGQVRHPDSTCQKPRERGSRPFTVETRLSEIRNIWVCSDSELARRACGSSRHVGGEADLACLMLVDAPAGPVSVVERSAEAREEFLDCISVLISAQRLRSEPEAACRLPRDGPPPPEARLRPSGRSLQSSHLSGPICAWLAQVGEEILPAPSPDESGAGGSACDASEMLLKLGRSTSTPTLMPQRAPQILQTVPVTDGGGDCGGGADCGGATEVSAANSPRLQVPVTPMVSMAAGAGDDKPNNSASTPASSS